MLKRPSQQAEQEIGSSNFSYMLTLNFALVDLLPLRGSWLASDFAWYTKSFALLPRESACGWEFFERYLDLLEPNAVITSRPPT